MRHTTLRSRGAPVVSRSRRILVVMKQLGRGALKIFTRISGTSFELSTVSDPNPYDSPALAFGDYNQVFLSIYGHDSGLGREILGRGVRSGDGLPALLRRSRRPSQRVFTPLTIVSQAERPQNSITPLPPNVK